MDEYIFSAENTLAGYILVDALNVIHAVQGIVRTSDFSNGHARAVYEAAARLVGRGIDADPVQIQNEAKELGTVLPGEYCEKQMRMYRDTDKAVSIAQIVHDEAVLRDAGEIGQKLAYHTITPLDAYAELGTLLQSKTSILKNPMEVANDVMDEIERASRGEVVSKIPTGISGLDRQLSGGLSYTGLTTIAARPGTGKTTVGITLAENIARSRGSVLYFSLEMSANQIWHRRIAKMTRINSANIEQGKLQDDEWQKVMEAMEILSQKPFFIRDFPSSLEDIESEARRMANLALIVIDHIGLIKTNGNGSRYEIMTAISHRLKQLALSLKVPILALCQLNRQSEARESKRPTTADLRDSGAIEEDSDVVCLLFRKGAYAPDGEKPSGTEVQPISLYIDKNRYGDAGAVELNYVGAYALITDKAYE